MLVENTDTQKIAETGGSKLFACSLSLTLPLPQTYMRGKASLQTERCEPHKAGGSQAFQEEHFRSTLALA